MDSIALLARLLGVSELSRFVGLVRSLPAKGYPEDASTPLLRVTFGNADYRLRLTRAVA